MPYEKISRKIDLIISKLTSIDLYLEPIEDDEIFSETARQVEIAV